MNVGWRHGTTQEPGADTDGPADAAFPCRRDVLDTAVVAAALPGAGGPSAPDDALLDVYYYPGRTLQAVHRIGGRVLTVHAAPADTAALPALSGDLPLPRLHAVARLFPVDPGLPTLAAVHDELGPAVDLLTYLPGLRAVLGTADRVLKIRNPAQTARAHRSQVLLWAAPSRRFAMAEPLDCDADRWVRRERRCAGRSVESCLTDMSHVALAELVADGLAGLHRLDLADPACRELPRLGPAHLLDRLERKTLRTVGRALPDLSTRSIELAAALRASVPAGGTPSVLHGDFHLANLLVADTGLVILDLDELSVGDPELDLAMFASRLLLVALHRGDPPAGTTDLVRHLLGAYEQACGRPVDQRRFAWYVAAGLLGRQVKTSIRHLAPDLHQLCAALLTVAERTLAGQCLDAALVAGVAA